MMKRIAASAAPLAIALCYSATSHAETPSRDADAYCRYVRSVSQSETAILVAPEVFGTAGIVSGADATTGGSALAPTTRLIVGANYSASRLLRGVNVSARVDAECERYRAVSQLHAFLENNREAQSTEALGAKIAVLERAIPRAEQILAQTRAQVAEQRASVQRLNATQLRVDELRAKHAEAKRELDALAGLPPAPTVAITALVRERDDAEARVERYDARIRQSFGWDVSLRGGYDRIYGVRDYTPLFGTVTVTFNVGWLLQHGADDRAVSSRPEWARLQVEGVDDRVERAIVRLRATEKAERERFAQTTMLAADLEARLHEAETVGGGDTAREYAEYLWFDLVKTQAEREYYRAHLKVLARLLGEPRAETP